jgi:thiosulfate reductase cytochrome b subunit
VRHSAVVRITHWSNAASFAALLVSGFAILLAHPRLYWGDTGAVGTPSLIDLPLPFVLVGQSGWGRYLHFLSAWVCVLTGVIYVLHGLGTGHFRTLTYNVLQRLTYLTVVFALFPLMIWSGLAMSPAITSVFPGVVSVLSGQQSARTIHFFVATALAFFVLGHIWMVSLAGFAIHVRMMITGWSPADKEER